MAITDHETLSAHVQAIQTTQEINKLYTIYSHSIMQEYLASNTNLQDKTILSQITELLGCNSDDIVATLKKQKILSKMSEPFKLILGNEIYLVDELEGSQEYYQSGVTKFYHFILLAKNKEGHKQLRQLSSSAWDNSYHTGQMERVPTFKKNLEQIIQGGHVIGSTGCLGGEFSQLVLQLLEHQNAKNDEMIKVTKKRINYFLKWCIQVFGQENFFIEIQPSNITQLSKEYDLLQVQLQQANDQTEIDTLNKDIEQKWNSLTQANIQAECNKMAITIAKAYNLEWIVSTDSHYLKQTDRPIHAAFLNSKEGDRELADFYSMTYMMDTIELRQYLDYLKPIDIEKAIDNTDKIGTMVENYDLKQEVIVPRIDLPSFEVKHIFKKGYEQFPYIKEFAHSDDEQDRYLLKLIEDGFKKKIPYNTINKEMFYTYVERINIELAELWEITKEINTKLSAYYITTREIINIMWEEGDSFVGVARGSVTGFLMAYLIDITQLNPIDWNLPHWRHLTRTRPELPDIDIDSQASRRKTIIEALKIRFGERKVLNIVTFGTEGSRSALMTSARGLGLDHDTAQYLADFIPFERGANWSLSDCVYGDEEKERKPIKEFINEVNKYEHLLETAMNIEGLVTKRSIHASGVYIFKDDFIEQNARMKAPNGTYVTQFNMEHSDYLGGLKVDLLTIQALDKERVCVDLLIKDGLMEWQGSLRDTYNKYLHPDVLDYTTPEMWKMIGDNAIIDLFQFDTEVGLQAAQKVKPTSMFELAVTNSLMRLMADGEVSPIDEYVSFKNNIDLWYKEMQQFGLTKTEIQVLEKHLKAVYGVADTQEVVMQLSMDKDISNFDLKKANKLRKGIAKKKGKVQEEVKKLFYEQGVKTGSRMDILNYVWNVQIKRQLGYSFSINHTTPYSCIALQEMNLAYHYPIIYWNTACLSINAGADEDNDNNQGTDYGKIATALSNMQQRGIEIAFPDINSADFGFKPDLTNNRIIFGLKGINGIGDEIVQTIIANRPYTSFQDFFEKMGLPKPTGIINDKGKPITTPALVKANQIVQLIKGGCFDVLENKNRIDIMRAFISQICDPKTKLTMANLNMLINHGVLSPHYLIYEEFLQLINEIDKRVFAEVPNTNPKSKKKYSDRLLAVPPQHHNLINKYFQSTLRDYDKNDLLISENAFNAEYKAKIKEIKQILDDPNTLSALNEALLNTEWQNRCAGTISSWEMSSLSYYYHDHELAHINKDIYSIVNFFDLELQPTTMQAFMYKGVQRYKFELSRICGVVLDRDKHKHIVTLLTPDGVVNLKYYSGAFSHYDKQISKNIIKKNGEKGQQVIEKSWFARGNLIMVCGFRRDNQFVVRKYADSIFQHTTMLITNIDENGNCDIQAERRMIDNE